MPLLLGLKVPRLFLAICWLISPVAGMALHPCVGKFSDTCGRRPFIITFGTLAAVGLFAIPLNAMAGSFAAVAAIAAFGLADTAHDLLVTPARAAMNDVFDAETAEWRSAVSSGVGKLIAQLLAALLTTRAAFFSVGALAAVAVAAQLALPPEAQSPSAEKAPQANRALVAPKGFWLMWTLNFAGWFSVNTFMFYVTSVWAEEGGAIAGSSELDKSVRVATGLLTCSSVIFVGVGFVLPRLVRFCAGEINCMMMALLVLACTMLSFGTSRYLAGALLVIASPVAYQVVANSPFAWLEQQPGHDEAERGRLTGWLNTGLSASQAIVAVTSGPVVTVASGRLFAAFVVVAAVDLLVVLVALAHRARECHTDGIKNTALA